MRIIVLVGPPGSGKSTFAEEIAVTPNEIVSSDKIRGIIFDDERIQGRQVWPIFNSLIAARLSAERNVIADATNVKLPDFRRVLGLIRAFTDEKITVVLFDTPLEQCIKNNRSRWRSVNETTLKNMHGTYMRNRQRFFESSDFAPIEVVTRERF